ncbi:hypothetical protein K227x_46230 [Rubripirellula lacrimiformis]|uniref:Transcobalamin-like C-terminal domain-containing protein n=1 Tax=Rubripirellula lacrimiformis TaxID=1930273 RepID=A0A517NGF2_9BACT|nr:DUF4430 domain-containing protein [Rubripirellula lacrimiformis]QDT06215.1 hypothetical protein K227x_46230 [Rubripirellula lacrimiformis]
MSIPTRLVPHTGSFHGVRRGSASALHALCLVIAMLVLVGCGGPAATLPESTDAATDDSLAKSGQVASGLVTIEVAIDGDTQTFTVDQVAEGTSLENVMRSVDGLDVDISGSGTTAFVNSIAGKATSASEGWTFTIDGEFANAGVGSTELTPPTSVAWKFTDSSALAQ